MPVPVPLDASVFPGFLPPFQFSRQETVGKETILIGFRLNCRFIPQVIKWFAQHRLKSAGTIVLTIPAGDDRLTFDPAENEPGRTIKAHPDFTG